MMRNKRSNFCVISLQTCEEVRMNGVKKYWLSIGFALGFISPAYADVVPVYEIKQTSSTYIQTRLTHDIYRYSSNSQLTDLLVVDQQGNKLPYRISAPSAETSVQREQIPVRFFPVPVGAAPETLLIFSSASIRLDDNEISVSAEKGMGAAAENPAAPTDFYLVDLSDLKTRADQLSLLWPVNEAHQYLEVEVSGTNDMSNWAPITTTTLVQLQKNGEFLTRNKIPLNLGEMQYAYLRLKFIRGAENLILTQVQVENSQALTKALQRDTWELDGSLVKSTESALRAQRHTPQQPVAAWEFERDDIAPVSKASITLGDIQYGDIIHIFSRANSKKPWNLVHQGVWFNVQVGNEWQQSNAIALHNNTHTQWRVELHETLGAKTTPKLVFERDAQTLEFIANNAAPYRIAIDNQTTTDHLTLSSQIFSQLTTGKDIQWQQTALEPLNPSLSSFSRHQFHVSWKTVLFWLVLIGAVSALIWVAVRLVGQMKNQQTK
jgi:hypothetical protein